MKSQTDYPMIPLPTLRCGWGLSAKKIDRQAFTAPFDLIQGK